MSLLDTIFYILAVIGSLWVMLKRMDLEPLEFVNGCYFVILGIWVWFPELTTSSGPALSWMLNTGLPRQFWSGLMIIIGLTQLAILAIHIHLEYTHHYRNMILINHRRTIAFMSACYLLFLLGGTFFLKGSNVPAYIILIAAMSWDYLRLSDIYDRHKTTGKEK